MNILAISGSLRDGSLNSALIQAAVEDAPASIQMDTFDIGTLPFYNGDVDRDGLRPESVKAFAAAIRSADALLIATPEYNHGVPGVLANAMDWGSRPLRGTAPLRDKPIAVMGASPGIIGAARAQDALKEKLFHIGAAPMPRHGLVVGSAMKKIEQGRLIDADTRKRLGDLIQALVEFTSARMARAD